MDGSWLLDELAHAGPEHLDRDFVAGYDRKQGYRDVAADLAALRQLGALRPDATVVDMHRIAQILRPGGVLRLHDLVYDFQPADAEVVLQRWLAEAATDPATGYTRQDFATHIRTEFSTYSWLLEPLLGATGFAIVDSSVERQIYATYSCRKQ